MPATADGRRHARLPLPEIGLMCTGIARKARHARTRLVRPVVATAAGTRCRRRLGRGGDLRAVDLLRHRRVPRSGAGRLGCVILFMTAGHVPGSASAIGGPFKLIDQDGKPITEADFKGRPLLVFFGYTHCPDVCPTTLYEMSEVLHALGKDA